VIIYTAIFGPKDDLQEPNLPLSHDLVCYTDQDLKSSSWKIIHRKPAKKDTRAEAKWYKMNSHVLFPGEKTIWIDGNYKIFHDPITVFQKKDISVAAFYHHASRRCLYDEADVCLERNAGNSDDIKKQILQYLAEAFPRNYGLYQGNIIFRVPTEETSLLNIKWQEQQALFSNRDQISLPYVIWKNDINVHIMTHKEKRKHFMKACQHKFHGTRSY
jgi:hypothetical protein